MKKKQIFSMVLTASMLCNMPYIVQAGQEFSDLSPSSWCYGYVMTMVGHGLLSGYPDNTFRQDGYITRAETATALHKLGLPAVLVSKTYTDVQHYAWYYKAVQDAYRSGVVLGLNHDTTGDYFSPDRYLTRADAAIIASRLYGLQKNSHYTQIGKFKDYNEIQSNAKMHVQNLVRAGIMSGYPDDTFRPNQAVTRAEFSRIFNFISYTPSEKLADNLEDALAYENVLQKHTAVKEADIDIFIPNQLYYGQSSNVTVRLETKNIPDGTTIALSLSNNGSNITIPASVKVYHNTASFEMYTSRYTERQTYTLTATYEGKNFSETFYLNQEDKFQKDVFIKEIAAETTLRYGRNNTIEVTVTTADIPDGAYVKGNISGSGLYLEDETVKVRHNKAVFLLHSKSNTPTGVYPFTASYQGHTRKTDIVVSKTNTDTPFVIDAVVQRDLQAGKNDCMDITIYTNQLENGQSLSASIAQKSNGNTMYPNGLGLTVSTPVLVYDNKATFIICSCAQTPVGKYEMIITKQGSTHHIPFYVGEEPEEEPEKIGSIRKIEVDGFLHEGYADAVQVIVKTKDMKDGTVLYPNVERGLTTPSRCTVYDNRAEFYVRNRTETKKGSYGLWFDYGEEMYKTYVCVK